MSDPNPGQQTEETTEGYIQAVYDAIVELDSDLGVVTKELADRSGQSLSAAIMRTGVIPAKVQGRLDELVLALKKSPDAQAVTYQSIALAVLEALAYIG